MRRGCFTGTTFVDYSVPEPAHAELTPIAGGLAFRSSYDRALVEEFKRQVPATARKWDPAKRVWLVAAQYGTVCARLAQQFLGVTVRVPVAQAATTTETRLLRLEYLGRTKQREDGEASAFGWADGSWSVVVSESVLREWFEATPQAPNERPTLYAVLGIRAAATLDDVRAAYRRMARQWHPDVCREPDAAAQFKAIHGAYEVLGDELKRRKYDAGLRLEAAARSKALPHTGWRLVAGGPAHPDYDGYRSPLRCGWVLCEGTESLGRFVVSKVIQWEDVTDSHGRVMVTSWPMGAKQFTVAWQ